MSEHAAGGVKKVFTVAREHLSNAVIGGVFLMLTGFTPEHWIVEFLHTIHLSPEFFRPLSFGIDPRLLAIMASLWRISSPAIMNKPRQRPRKPAPTISPGC